MKEVIKEILKIYTLVIQHQKESRVELNEKPDRQGIKGKLGKDKCE